MRDLRDTSRDSWLAPPGMCLALPVPRWAAALRIALGWVDSLNCQSERRAAREL